MATTTTGSATLPAGPLAWQSFETTPDMIWPPPDWGFVTLSVQGQTYTFLGEFTGSKMQKVSHRTPLNGKGIKHTSRQGTKPERIDLKVRIFNTQQQLDMAAMLSALRMMSDSAKPSGISATHPLLTMHGVQKLFYIGSKISTLDHTGILHCELIFWDSAPPPSGKGVGAGSSILPWMPSTTYLQGNKVSNGGAVYVMISPARGVSGPSDAQIVAAGASGATPSQGPLPTNAVGTAGARDGTIVWKFVSTVAVANAAANPNFTGDPANIGVNLTNVTSNGLPLYPPKPGTAAPLSAAPAPDVNTTLPFGGQFITTILGPTYSTPTVFGTAGILTASTNTGT